VTPPQPVDYQFRLGEPWLITVACTDPTGAAIPNAPVALRIASNQAVVHDAVQESGDDGTATFCVAPTDQAFVAGDYLYQTRAWAADASTYDQQFGMIGARPNLFTAFPFSLPALPGELDGSSPAQSGLIATAT
jgi:hypothetical protein